MQRPGTRRSSSRGVQNFLSGRPAYEAIECWKAPKQGRSGGGLFTDNGYIAGVCDFAEPQGDHGLYATPRSIYHLLDRNNLMALYSPPTRGTGTMVADNRSSSRARAGSVLPVARSQSPDREEPDRGRGREAINDDTLPPPPHPTLLGIVIPEDRSPVTRHTNWQPKPASTDESDSSERDLSGEINQERYVPPADKPKTETSDTDREAGVVRQAADSSAGSSSKMRWRAVKSGPSISTENDQN